MRPPWTRWSATHPHRRTRLPTSVADKSPQSPVRLTHSRELSRGDGDDLALVMCVPAAEAETEKRALFPGIALGSGLRMARSIARELERREMRGKALRRRRDMAVLSVTETGKGFWVTEIEDRRGFKDNRT